MALFPKDRNLADRLEHVDLQVRASDYGELAWGFEVRLDAFLQRHLHWRSRTSIQRLIRDGFVLVCVPPPDRPISDPWQALERVTRVGTRLRHGSSVRVIIPEEQRLEVDASGGEELSVLYEDQEAIAIDKPAGLPVHPSGRHLTDTLIQRVHARYRTPEDADPVKEAPAGDRRTTLPIRLCHRLDRETSGIVLCGIGRAHRRISIQFERRRVEKEYLAIVYGRTALDSGSIELPLGPARASRVHLKMAIQQDGLPARTTWRVVERYADRTLVACQLHTGRQHQIRVHLAAIGHPIVGDKLYGLDEGYFLRSAAGELTDEDRRRLELPRHALHHHRLVYRSPRTGKPREIVSPLPEDLDGYLSSL